MLELTKATLVTVVPATSTLVIMTKIASPLYFKSPISQILFSYCPSESSEMYVMPAGNTSLTYTPVALDGPWLTTVIVQVISSPYFGVLSETTFVTSKSACGIISNSVALLICLYNLSSGCSE